MSWLDEHGHIERRGDVKYPGERLEDFVYRLARRLAVLEILVNEVLPERLEKLEKEVGKNDKANSAKSS